MLNGLTQSPFIGPDNQGQCNVVVSKQKDDYKKLNI